MGGAGQKAWPGEREKKKIRRREDRLKRKSEEGGGKFSGRSSSSMPLTLLFLESTRTDCDGGVDGAACQTAEML
jgi:hypothetical protein